MKEEKSSVDELRGLLKTEKNSPKVLTEEECMACLNQFFEDTNYYLGDVIYNDHNDEFDVLSQLIKEHFELVKEFDEIKNPYPYKFDELKEEMWIWDNQQKECILIDRLKFVVVHINDYSCYIFRKYSDLPIKFEENRFFPLTKAMQYQEKEVDV